MLLFTLLMFLKNVLSIQNQQDGICSNSTNGKPLECCRNYQLIMNSCTECPPGKHGWNCSDECPPTFYGRFCREICSCDPCDKVNGCFNNSGSYGNENGDRSTFHLPTILISVSGCFVLCVLFCLATLFSLRFGKKKSDAKRSESKKVNISGKGETTVTTIIQDRYDHISLDEPGYVTLKMT
ncbi:uncharacterized protein LOC111138299 isoform X2 [Crassostrea virginica]